MTLLGIDTSTAASAACVLRDDGVAFEAIPVVAELGAPPAHSRDLLRRMAEVLERAGLGFGDVEAVAVGVGPGAFTGLRVGIATARALASAHGLELRPVSSLAALAAGVEEGARLPLIDARRRELFAALHGPAGETLIGPFVAAPADVLTRVLESGANPLAVGDGSLRFRGLFEAAGVRVAPPESELHLVRALHVCRLAASAEPVPAEAVLPTYIRPPDAKPRPT